MNAMQVCGVLAPVVSTFRADGEELDVDAFAANARAHVAAGLDGLVVAGSTGEAALLDAAERGALIEAARAVVPRDRLLIAGTGAESTRTCLRQTREAATRGADAVLVVAPHYYGAAMTEDALRVHYRRVADDSPVPVLLYNIPKYMHFALAPALVAELATHENVIGIKDSSGQRDLLDAYIAVQSETFSVLTGASGLLQHSLMAGGRGGILAVSLFAPGPALAVRDAVARGDAAAASLAQARLDPLGTAIVGALGVPGVKAAMDGVGLSGGAVRAPLLSLSAEQRSVVDDLLRRAELAVAA